MSLEDFTDSDRSDHEMAKLQLAKMLTGRDYDDRLSASDLAEHVPVSASTVRDLVKEIRRERGIAVYSRGSGYWHIQDAGELSEAIEAINDEINTRQETKRQLTKAYNRRVYEYGLKTE